MPINQALLEFKQSVSQCENLIASVHKVEIKAIFSLSDREQITCAAFLNMFIAWEEFLEKTLKCLMTGAATTLGKVPVKYVSPSTTIEADQMIRGVGRSYFDYANHDRMREIAKLFFDGGYPYEPHLSSIFVDLADLKTMRNSCAHISSTTQSRLELLAQRLFNKPMPGIKVYDMLIAVDPKSQQGETIFASYKNKLIVVAELISKG